MLLRSTISNRISNRSRNGYSEHCGDARTAKSFPGGRRAVVVFEKRLPRTGPALSGDTTITLCLPRRCRRCDLDMPSDRMMTFRSRGIMTKRSRARSGVRLKKRTLYKNKHDRSCENLRNGDNSTRARVCMCIMYLYERQ